MSSQDYKSESVFRRIQGWYRNECNGDWEHSFGIKIETLDNPGWLVTVDLVETHWESLTVERKIDQRTELDWVQFEVLDGRFLGCGGSQNLEEILTIFFELIDAEE